MSSIAIFLIRLYQRWIDPLLPPSCRFEPTCSEYSIEAFRVYGFVRGALLSGYRILRCNPFLRGGYDPLKR